MVNVEAMLRNYSVGHIYNGYSTPSQLPNEFKLTLDRLQIIRADLKPLDASYIVDGFLADISGDRRWSLRQRKAIVNLIEDESEKACVLKSLEARKLISSGDVVRLARNCSFKIKTEYAIA